MSLPDEHEQLHALAAFLPAFKTRGFEIGTWTPPGRGPDGVMGIGFFTFSEVGQAFIEMARSNGWVDPSIDWPIWASTEAAQRFRDDPSLVAGAGPDDLRRLLTTIIRSERFGDGEIEAAYRSGLLTAIVRRAAVLVELPSVIHGPPNEGSAQGLTLRPQVLSFDKAGSWPQERLKPYRQEIVERFGSVKGDGLSFRLECGLGPTADLEAAGDLDNLLVPVIDALGTSRFVAAWGAKDAGTVSQLAVGHPSVIQVAELADWSHATARTTVSAGTEAWKERIAEQVRGSEPLPADVAAALVIAFRVGPGRAWHNLWKPAIDALGSILGVPGPRRWHPRDGRIVELGLSVEVVDGLGWDIWIDCWWQPRPWPK